MLIVEPSLNLCIYNELAKTKLEVNARWIMQPDWNIKLRKLYHQLNVNSSQDADVRNIRLCKWWAHTITMLLKISTWKHNTCFNTQTGLHELPARVTSESINFYSQCSSDAENLRKTQTGSPPMEAPNAGGVD